MALRPGVWLLLRALTLLSAPHPDRPIEKRRARGRVVAADYQVPAAGREILVH